MTIRILTGVLKRVETWPEDAQEELAAIALEIDSALKGAVYQATPEELVGIDRGLRAADDRRFASSKDVASVLVKRRRV